MISNFCTKLYCLPRLGGISRCSSAHQPKGACGTDVTKHSQNPNELAVEIQCTANISSCHPAAGSPAFAAGIIGLETKDGLFTTERRQQQQQSAEQRLHSSGAVVDMGKVVGVLRSQRSQVPPRSLGDDEGGGGGGGGGQVPLGGHSMLLLTD